VPITSLFGEYLKPVRNFQAFLTGFLNSLEPVNYTLKNGMMRVFLVRNSVIFHGSYALDYLSFLRAVWTNYWPRRGVSVELEHESMK
jgi:hypothetical protein